MKVGIVTNNITGNGGIETVLNSVFKSEFLGRKIQFELFINSAVMRTDWKNSIPKQVKITSKNYKSQYMRLIDLTHYLIAANLDEVIVMSPKVLPIVVAIRNIFHKHFKVVSWIHFSLENSIFKHPEWVKYADANLAISSGIANQMKQIGIDEDQIFTIYNPVAICPTKLVENSSEEILDLVYIGQTQFLDQKNLKELFDGLRGLTISWKLRIFGNGTDRKQCEEYTRNLGISSQITWCGWVENPWNVITECTALVLTSNYEGFPMVLVEAMSHGVPCVASNCPTGPDDIIMDGVNGYLYELGNIGSLQAALKSIGRMGGGRKSIVDSVYKFRTAEYDARFYSALKQINTGGSMDED